MGGTVEIKDKGVTINIDGGGKIFFGKLGDADSSSEEPLPSLTAEEEIYGRTLCLLPSGWEALCGDEPWQHHLKDPLRQLWPSFSREQKMAIAYTVSELADDLRDSAYSHAW